MKMFIYEDQHRPSDSAKALAELASATSENVCLAHRRGEENERNRCLALIDEVIEKDAMSANERTSLAGLKLRVATGLRVVFTPWRKHSPDYFRYSEVTPLTLQGQMESSLVAQYGAGQPHVDQWDQVWWILATEDVKLNLSNKVRDRVLRAAAAFETTFGTGPTRLRLTNADFATINDAVQSLGSERILTAGDRYCGMTVEHGEKLEVLA